MKPLTILLLAAVLASLPVVAQDLSTSQTVPDQTFLLTLDVEAGYAICPAPDGNVFAIGARDEEMVLLKISPEGKVLSADYLGVGDGSPVYPVSAILDSEGKLAIMGRHEQTPNARSFILRYDPELRKTLWARISEQNFFSTGSIADMPSQNAYAVCFSNFSIEVVRLNRQNGLILPASAFGYRLDSLTWPKRIVLHQDDVFVVGSFVERSSAKQYKGVSPFIMRASMNGGIVAWAKGSPVAPVGSAALHFSADDVLIENNAVYSIFTGINDGLQPYTYLQRQTPDGALIWLKRIEFPQVFGQCVSQMFSVPDGFIFYGNSGNDFIVKTNKNGEVQWAYRSKFSTGSSCGIHQAMLFNGALYITGTMTSVSPAQMFVMKIDIANISKNSCSEIVPMVVLTTETASDGDREPLLLLPNDPLFILNWPASPPVPFFPQTTLLCGPTGDCSDKPDLTFEIDGTSCAGGAPAVSYTICNTGAVEVGGEVPVWFYADDPTQTAVAVLGSATLTLDPPLPPGECRSGQLAGLAWLDPTQTQSVFSVINYDNALPTPFSLADLPTTDLEECNYQNNLSSTQMSWPPAPILDLGPDLILCDKNSALLDAGPDFVQYLWQDGSTAQTFTATEPGLYYRVEATDACGRIQRDSVFFTFSLLPDTRFGDTVICPGEAVPYTLPGFDAYQWAPATGLNCTTCPEVIAQPSQPTTYTVLATDSLGCVLRDTFTIEFYPSQPTLQCPSNITVVAAPGGTSAVVHYDAPNSTTDCPCGDAIWTLTQGMPSGANFPLGNTTICFSAEDGCLNTASCCFVVSVSAPPPADEPCEVKETPCLRFEILGIFQNPKKQKTYRMRVVNKCAAEMVSIAYELPQGLTAVSPPNGSTYTAPSGRQYLVRNPHLAPQRSVRFSTIDTGISLGQSDIFEYTLPPQANQAFIYTYARLSPQTYVETHLNVAGCKVQQTQTLLEDGANAEERSLEHALSLTAERVFPTPATDRVYVDVSHWPAGTMRLWVVDGLGRILWEEADAVSGGLYVLPLPAHWPAGVYYLTATTSDGQCMSARIVK